MTKAELQSYIASRQTFIAANGPETLEETRANGDKIYRRNIIKLKGTSAPDNLCAGYVNVYYVVRNEGEASEAAYLLVLEPEPLCD
jgi:hypothetical protein